MKRRLKRLSFLLGFVFIIWAGLFSSTPFINKYWLPKEVRVFLVQNKYTQGECLSSKRWGVNPKVVVGHKEYKNSTSYLLKDMDRHEHIQLVSNFDVEKYAIKTSCRI